MAAPAAFLPPHLLQSLARRKRLPEPPFVEKFPAALLFSDVSGFTALTEKLQAGGREAAEEIAGIIDRVFRPSIRAIEAQGGSIVSFGGDALFTIFPGSGAVLRAVAAAEGVRDTALKAGRQRTSAGLVELGVSQGIHFGVVKGTHLGAGDRRHYLVTGPSVASVARMEAQAEAGEFRLSPRANSRFASERSPRPSSTKAYPSSLVEAYLDPRLPLAVKGFRGEYRRASVLFLETKGAAVRKLQSLFEALAEVLDRYEGLLLKSDLSISGTKWLNSPTGRSL